MAFYFGSCIITLALLAVLSEFSNDGENSFIEILFAMLIVFVGFGWGCGYTLFPLITGESYAIADFGFIFSCVQIGPLITTFTLPSIAAYIYVNLVCFSSFQLV